MKCGIFNLSCRLQNRLFACFILDPVIPFLEVTVPMLGVGSSLHLSLKLVVGGCNASSAELRFEEAVSGSAFGGRASRRSASWTHLIPVNRRRRGCRRRCTRPAFGGGTGVNPPRTLTRLPPRPPLFLRDYGQISPPSF